MRSEARRRAAGWLSACESKLAPTSPAASSEREWRPLAYKTCVGHESDMPRTEREGVEAARSAEQREHPPVAPPLELALVPQLAQGGEVLRLQEGSRRRLLGRWARCGVGIRRGAHHEHASALARESEASERLEGQAREERAEELRGKQGEAGVVALLLAAAAGLSALGAERGGQLEQPADEGVHVVSVHGSELGYSLARHGGRQGAQLERQRRVGGGGLR